MLPRLLHNSLSAVDPDVRTYAGFGNATMATTGQALLGETEGVYA